MPLRSWSLAAALALTAAPAAAAPTPQPHAATDSDAVDRAAGALAERLVAPCCWRESLRGHPSPLADDLRREIRDRLAAGEPAERIEQDLITRFGPRIRAFSPDWDPRSTAGVIWFSVATASLALVVLWTRRQRRQVLPLGSGTAGPHDARLERLLDDALDRDAS